VTSLRTRRAGATRWLIVLVLSGLFAASCGGGADGSVDTTASPTEETSMNLTPAEELAASGGDPEIIRTVEFIYRNLITDDCDDLFRTRQMLMEDAARMLVPENRRAWEQLAEFADIRSKEQGCGPAPFNVQSLDSRETMAAAFDDAGWATYTDDVTGWSIRHPADWSVDAVAGEALWLYAPSTEGWFLVSFGPHQHPDDASSADYLTRGVADGVDAARWLAPEGDPVILDSDLDGVDDPQDIAVMLLWATQDLEGKRYPAGQEAPIEWAAYYDPAADPPVAYDFILSTAPGSALYEHGATVLLSFEPPGGFP